MKHTALAAISFAVIALGWSCADVNENTGDGGILDSIDEENPGNYSDGDGDGDGDGDEASDAHQVRIQASDDQILGDDHQTRLTKHGQKPSQT